MSKSSISPDCLEDFNRDSSGKIIASNQMNIRMALRMLGVKVCFNAFADKLLIEGPDNLSRRPLGDAEVDRIYLAIDQSYAFRPTPEFFRTVLFDAARQASFHPVRDYLASLRWDGTPRISRWLTEYALAEDTPFVRAAGRILLIAACRRVRHPGVKFDEMIVLESPQGRGKSTGLEVMAVNDEWFTDDLPLNADSQKVIEAIAGRWIVEAAELKGLRKGDVEHLKAFLSRRSDRARMAYGRLTREFPRQCVFVGTTNSAQYLRDGTGNRRFWPVRIDAFDIDRLLCDRDQLWAEAAHAEAAGESIRLDLSLYREAAAQQERVRVEDPWLNVLGGALSDRKGKLLAEDAWIIVDVPAGSRTQDHNVRLGEAMRELGWERTRLRFDGPLEYCYARGHEEERRHRILVERDRDSQRLKVVVEIDRDPP